VGVALQENRWEHSSFAVPLLGLLSHGLGSWIAQAEQLGKCSALPSPIRKGCAKEIEMVKRTQSLGSGSLWRGVAPYSERRVRARESPKQELQSKEAGMSDARPDQLTAKHQSVLNILNQPEVQLRILHVQDNKLVIRGHAKIKADSNKAWDPINLVDKNNQQHLMAEITYAAELAAAASASQTRTFTVKAGDSFLQLLKPTPPMPLNTPQSSRPTGTN
jgi:hypothetical protein